MLLSLWVHVPLAIAWIGLVMFDVLVARAPPLSAAQRGRLIAQSRWLVVVAAILLVATGIWQTANNPISPVGSYEELTQLRERTAYGQALFWKHGCVLATFGLTIAVRFVLAPRLAAANGPAASTQRWVLGLSVANLAACLGAVLLATRMIFALH
jgi:putative copper export protein